MTLQSGAQLGHYEIVAPLGAGGMGEVYRARDPKLEREVAIKVLPADFAADPERLARFEREAKALAALNHPNVATLHGFDRDGDTRFLVMELVEGEDLAARLARGPMTVEEALPLFVQIAEGLEAAHREGIVHRDLKPANVRVSSEDSESKSVKLVDFGLARAVAPAGTSSVDLSASPTMTAGATLRGAIMGTAPYMSPEQARGIPADPRTDVWAFGCCLYEALTGSRPFQGEDAAQILASVLKDTPDWSALPGDVPPNVAVLLRRCLEKSRRKRLQSIGDARVELEESVSAPEELAPVTSKGGVLVSPSSLSPVWKARGSGTFIPTASPSSRSRSESPRSSIWSRTGLKS